ncbi:MAG: efflux RND transporter periplasmic adaptor subunit [Candidatus Cloacimonetes bacterium]|nr:efflux RND transporter periplasmic adaptor subunit [Candidatus Cloacimonadota bacterium]
MDRIIEKKKWPLKKIIWFSLGGSFVIFVLANIIFADRSTKLNVRSERISIEEVVQDYFQDYISITGTVDPIRTVYLDAMEGGRVEDIILEEGTMVEKGDIILKLSNTNLHLDILNREANLAEQMNNLRNTRIMMEQRKLDLKEQILELDYLIQQQRKTYLNNESLFEKNFISREDYDDSRDHYEYLINRNELLIESQKQDSLFRKVQIEQLEDSVQRMQDNLGIVRNKLEHLNVKAPISGELASVNAEIGQAISTGTRLGQINDLTSFKIIADIDEHYISRIKKNLLGEFEFANKTYKLKVTKIYTVVRNGRFSVDMVFTEDIPSNMRIGQTFRVKLELGDPKEAILIPKGGFYQTTGGQWIFVVNEAGDTAVKRNIRLGSMNPKYYEVLEGLEPGEKVIISSYDNFGNVDKLILKK